MENIWGEQEEDDSGIHETFISDDFELDKEDLLETMSFVSYHLTLKGQWNIMQKYDYVRDTRWEIESWVSSGMILKIMRFIEW